MNVIRCRPELPDTEQQVILDEVTYRLRLTWRGYCESWYLDLAAQDTTAILTGARLEAGANMLLLADSDMAPPGLLLVVETGAIGDDSNDYVRLDLGNGLQLVYVPAAEVP